MTKTFISQRIELIEKRFQEIEILLAEAINKQADLTLYSTFCRSAHVLLVAHFEGMVKDIVKDVLEDLSLNRTFKDFPNQIKRTHCQFFVNRNESGEYDEKLITKLIETFDTLPTKLKIEPFLFEKNKNPAPSIIENILKRFGLNKFLWSLRNSDIDIVFQDSKSSTINLKNRLKEYLVQNLKVFPYTVDETFYNPDKNIINQKPLKTPLWETFLDDLLMDRHSIVHGDTLENPTDHEEIKEAMSKVHILIFVFIIGICKAVSSSSNYLAHSSV